MHSQRSPIISQPQNKGIGKVPYDKRTKISGASATRKETWERGRLVRIRLRSQRTEAGGTPALPGFVARRAPRSFKWSSSTIAYLPNAALGHDAWASEPNGKTVCCGTGGGGGDELFRWTGSQLVP